jgi:methylmalonic aciduria homocystinuria type C protein
MSTWQHAAREIGRRCEAAGFDLVQPFRVGWYDAAVEPAYRLPDLGGPDRLGILVGNTRSMWPRFADWLRAEPARATRPHPLERYAMDSIGAAVAAAGLPGPIEIRHAHEPPPRRVAMQRLAEIAGLAWLSPSYLSIHPAHGPWISLRAAIVVGGLAGPGETDRPAMGRACHACEDAAGCRAALSRALEAGDPRARRGAIEENWTLWLAVRDACPVGRSSRFQEDHLRYGYTKDVSIPIALAGS